MNIIHIFSRTQVGEQVQLYYVRLYLFTQQHNNWRKEEVEIEASTWKIVTPVSTTSSLVNPAFPAPTWVVPVCDFREVQSYQGQGHKRHNIG